LYALCPLRRLPGACCRFRLPKIDTSGPGIAVDVVLSKQAFIGEPHIGGRGSTRRFDGGFTGALRYGELGDDNDHSRYLIIVQVWRITKALGWTKPPSDLVG
jgi:hypothetical protein